MSSVFDWWTPFHFIRPLWLLVLLPLALLVWLRWRDEEAQQQRQMLPPHLQQALMVGQLGWRKQLPLKVLTLVAVILTISAAGPTWQRQPSPFAKDQAPLVIVLDVSESMLQQDVAPSRLVRAKQKIEDLLKLRDGGRTAVIVYAGSAHLLMPLTDDAEVLLPMLNAVTPAIMPRAGKFPERALPLIEQQLLRAPVPGTVLLVSDGINPDSQAKWSEAFGRSPHQLVVLGMGDPTRSSQLPADWQGLQQLTSGLSASFTENRIDSDDIEYIADALQQQLRLQQDNYQPWQDAGYWLLYPAALLLLFWFRRGWLVQWGLVLALVLPAMQPTQVLAATTTVTNKSGTAVQAPTQIGWQQSLWQWGVDLWLSRDQQGQWYLDQGRYAEAAQQFQDPLRKGVAYYYDYQYSLAYSYFSQVDSDQGRLYASMALARQRDYVGARKLLRQSLKRSPEHTDMKRNLAELERIIGALDEFAQSQMGTPDGPESSKELGDDQPQSSDGVEEETAANVVKKQQLSAQQLLQDPKLTEQWLKRVEADPSRYLKAKFQVQLQQQEARP